jgi:hypothetical protein
MYCEIDIRATKSCIFPLSGGLMEKKIRIIKIQDLVAPMSISQRILLQLLARPPLLWQEHAWLGKSSVGAGSVKNIRGVSHLFIS